MVNSVRRDPRNGAGLQSKSPANREKSLEPSRCLETTMRQQPVITKADTPAARDPFHDQTNGQILPAKKEKRNDGEHVKNCYKDDRAPIYSFRMRGCKVDYVLH